VGETLGPYDLQEELGRGGMGVVYRAVHRPTGVVRALKVLDRAPDAEAMERFRREAAALARAQGMGVVPVHDLGVDGGRMFFAMPLLEAGSVQARLAAAGPLAWRDACALALEVARALARCHAVGLIHRDLKPANLLIDAAGRVNLADFGCVRDVAAPRLTQTGTMVGTPGYMAPELFRGAKADARADVYSLGAILYELVAGHAPYRGASPVQVFRQANARERPPLPVSAPPALESLVAAALEPDPAVRIASASDLAARLEALLAGSAGRPRTTWIAGLGAAGVATALVVSMLLTGSDAPAPPAVTPPPPVVTPAAADPPRADEYAAVRRLLDAAPARRRREQLRAIEDALPDAPAAVDSALAVRMVAAFWPGDDLTLAAEAFSAAARVDEAVPQPEGLVERLEELLPLPETGPDVVVALMRLGRRPSASMIVRHREALEGARRPGWAKKLALAHVLYELGHEGKASRLPAAELAAMHAHGLQLATEVDQLRLPRGARAAARLAALQHRAALPREGLAADLPHLMAYAADLDAPRGAYVLAAEIALDSGDLQAARPFIEGAFRAHAERSVPADTDVAWIRRPDRPWISPVPAEFGPSEDIDRFAALLRIVDERAPPATVLADLPPVSQNSIVRHLTLIGRPDDATRAQAFLDTLRGEAPAPPPR
jgi:hypothetical protein